MLTFCAQIRQNNCLDLGVMMELPVKLSLVAVFSIGSVCFSVLALMSLLFSSTINLITRAVEACASVILVLAVEVLVIFYFFLSGE